MKITEVKVFPVSEEKLKAFVSIVFDHCFMVNDIKVIQGRDGLFISMPSRRKKNGRFKDVAHPLNNDTRQMIERLVLAEYGRAAGLAPQDEEIVEEPREIHAPPPPAAAEEQPEEAATEQPVEEPAAEPEEGKSLEEVAELHLRDSFWST